MPPCPAFALATTAATAVMYAVLVALQPLLACPSLTRLATDALLLDTRVAAANTTLSTLEELPSTVVEARDLKPHLCKAVTNPLKTASILVNRPCKP